MAMSQKHYVAMARAINARVAEHASCPDDCAERRAIAEVTADMANIMYADNPRFDGTRFITAAGMGRWVEWYEGFSSKEARVIAH